MLNFYYVEVGIFILASIFTFLNFFINLRLSVIEERLTKLEDFEKKSQKSFEVLFKISGQIDIILERFKCK